VTYIFSWSPSLPLTIGLFFIWSTLHNAAFISLRRNSTLILSSMNIFITLSQSCGITRQRLSCFIFRLDKKYAEWPVCTVFLICIDHYCLIIMIISVHLLYKIMTCTNNDILLMLLIMMQLMLDMILVAGILQKISPFYLKMIDMVLLSSLQLFLCSNWNVLTIDLYVWIQCGVLSIWISSQQLLLSAAILWIMLVL